MKNLINDRLNLIIKERGINRLPEGLMLNTWGNKNILILGKYDADDPSILDGFISYIEEARPKNNMIFIPFYDQIKVLSTELLSLHIDNCIDFVLDKNEVWGKVPKVDEIFLKYFKEYPLINNDYYKVNRNFFERFVISKYYGKISLLDTSPFTTRIRAIREMLGVIDEVI